MISNSVDTMSSTLKIEYAVNIENRFYLLDNVTIRTNAIDYNYINYAMNRIYMQVFLISVMKIGEQDT